MLFTEGGEQGLGGEEPVAEEEPAGGVAAGEGLCPQARLAGNIPEPGVAGAG